MADTGDLTNQPYEPDPDDEDGPPVPRAGAMRKRALATRPKTRKTSVSRGGGRIMAREKQRKALELRKGGASYIDIAQACGYADQSGARKAVMAAFGELIQEPAVEVKSLQIERLNHMLLSLWPKINQGDERAIDTGLRIMDKVDRLMGTEAAAQVDVNVNQQGAILVIDGSKEDFIKAARQMAMGGVQPDGTNGPLAITDGAEGSMDLHPHPGDDVVDAELVEDKDASLADVLGEEGRQAVRDLMAPPDTPSSVPVRSGKKKYDFGVEPD